MSKMSELSQILDSLTETGNHMTECGQELVRAVSALREMFSGTQEEPANIKEETPKSTPAAKPKAEAKKLSFVDVRKAFSAKSHAGYTEQVKALIGKYGADKLSAVNESDYEALMADLEAIG